VDGWVGGGGAGGVRVGGAAECGRRGGKTGVTCLGVVIGILSGRVSWAANFLGLVEINIIEV